MIDRLEQVYGSQAVLSAAAEVLNAPKGISDGYVLNTGAPAHPSRPLMAFYYLLAKRDPKGFIRMLMMEGLNVPGISEADAAYQKLIARYPESKVLLAARGLVDPGELPAGLQPIAVSATHPASDSPGSRRGLIQVLAAMGGSAPPGASPAH